MAKPSKDKKPTRVAIALKPSKAKAGPTLKTSGKKAAKVIVKPKAKATPETTQIPGYSVHGVKIGRPHKLDESENTLERIFNLARIQCTQKEAASVLRVSEPTLIDFFKRSKKGAMAWEQGREDGRASLRRLQYQAAEKGSMTALVWLGKQYLDQRDKMEETSRVDQTVKQEVTIIDRSQAYKDLRDRIGLSFDPVPQSAPNGPLGIVPTKH